MSQLPTLLPTRFWEQVAVKSNPGRKHLLLRKRKQGGQDRHKGKRVRFCPQIAQSTLRQVAPLHCSSWGSAKTVTINPCFFFFFLNSLNFILYIYIYIYISLLFEGGSCHSSASPQMSTSLIPLLAALGITWGALKAADASRIVDF